MRRALVWPRELAERSGVFYGWWVVAVAFLCYGVTTGIFFYAFGVFLLELVATEGWSRAAIGAAYSIAQVMSAVYAPWVGRLVDRHGPKSVQIGGALVLSAGLLLLGRARSVIQFDVVMGVLMALGASALGGLSCNTAVASWFHTKRGRALGIATAGISMGGVVFVPLTHTLIGAFGWRRAFDVLAIVVVVMVLPAVALFMERAPQVGPGGEGGAGLEPAERAALEREIASSLAPAEAMRHPNFALLALALALSGAGLAVVLLHQITFLTDRGLGDRFASWSLGATAAMGVLGKLGFGWLLDRFDQRRVSALCFGLQSLGVAVLLATYDVGTMMVFVLVYGFAMGGTATLQATLVADCFGRAHYGAIYGRLLAFSVSFQAVAVPLAGYLRDRTGSYVGVFAALAVGTLISTVAALRLTFLTNTAPVKIET